MLIHNKKSRSRYRTVERGGSGVLNTIIDKLPIELHIPGYQFCGPGTRLHKRLARGDKGVNPLDEACREHDISYSKNINIEDRHKADKILADKAWNRFRSKDAGFGEKTAALTVAGAMKAKTKFGMGSRRSIKQRRRKLKRGGAISFNDAVKIAKKSMRNAGGSDLMKLAQAAATSLKKKKIIRPKHRIITVPKRGGVLPLLPLFAVLGALGSAGAGAAAIAKTVNDAKSAAKNLKENERHNKAMEALSIGHGLYLTPYNPNSKNFR